MFRTHIRKQAIVLTGINTGSKNLLLTGINLGSFDRRNDVNYPSKGEIITASFLFYPMHAENAHTFYPFSSKPKIYDSV